MKKNLKPGDIIQVELNEKKRYFQFIYEDEEYMAGHLIRAFQYEISANQKPDIIAIVNSPVEFYSYTRVLEGIKGGFWNHIGNSPIEIDFVPPTFRQTNDVASSTPKSKNWFIWKKQFSRKQFVGELTEEYKKLPVSSVFPPKAIVRWLETGAHGFATPE